MQMVDFENDSSVYMNSVLFISVRERSHQSYQFGTINERVFGLFLLVMKPVNFRGGR